MSWYNPGKVFSGYTVAIIAQGPSVVPEEAARISEIYPTIAIKDTYAYAPNAQIIYACDRAWWKMRWKTDELLRQHKADRVTLDYQKLDTLVPDLHWLKCGGNHGFCFEDGYVCHGRNTGHQALNLAVNLGGAKIILIGYDMKKIGGRTHCHDRHVPVPDSVFDDFYGAMMNAAPLLAAKKVKVINTSLASRLTCFPKMPIEQAIEWGRSI